MVSQEKGGLLYRHNGEMLLIQPWQENSFRVRATKAAQFICEDWALLPAEPIAAQIDIRQEKPGNQPGSVAASITNGDLTAQLTQDGKLRFLNSRGEVLLEEFEFGVKSVLEIPPRELKSLHGDSFHAVMTFQSDPDEKLFGMGQYQNGIFDLKGSCLELVQRNSQVSVPFVYSTKGYGFLWNNPAVGKAIFGRNVTQWEASSTHQIEYWITAGDTPRRILRSYMAATGKPPLVPEYALGFWQSKLRYRNQDELLTVARHYRDLGVPLAAIVVDFFHWPVEGTWQFDARNWPDPAAMVRELEQMGTKLIVSIWPTVATSSPHWQEMTDEGCLVRTEHGFDIQLHMLDDTNIVDFSNPLARQKVWQLVRDNYCRAGVAGFWLDAAEPRFSRYDFECYRYYAGAAAEVSNSYPKFYSQTFYDGQRQEGQTRVLNLVRSAWAGSQRFGSLVWSGDIPSTFRSLEIQLVCGLQMAMAGIPWWTTDIGGFTGGDIRREDFRELLVRWFQYGAFCPVMRLHGDRLPGCDPQDGELCGTGAENEIWSFGPQVYEILKKYINLRTALKPYLQQVMEQTGSEGDPVMRPLFYEFPEDETVWKIQDAFLLGEGLLAAPVVHYGQRSREVYLPRGAAWIDPYTGCVREGGQWVDCPAPLERMPVFVRESCRDELQDFMQACREDA